MKKISGVGLFKFQQDKAKELASKEMQKRQMIATSELTKSIKEKDQMIGHLFSTVNELNKEIIKLKGE